MLIEFVNLMQMKHNNIVEMKQIIIDWNSGF